DYPELEDTSDWDSGIQRPEDTIEQINDIAEDTTKAGIIASCLGVMIADMEYINLLAELDEAVTAGAIEQSVDDLAQESRDLGEKLYGKPDPKLADSAIAEVWRQIDSKHLSITAGHLYDQLESGFQWSSLSISPLARPEQAAALPDFNHPSLA